MCNKYDNFADFDKYDISIDLSEIQFAQSSLNIMEEDVSKGLFGMSSKEENNSLNLNIETTSFSVENPFWYRKPIKDKSFFYPRTISTGVEWFEFGDETEESFGETFTYSTQRMDFWPLLNPAIEIGGMTNFQPTEQISYMNVNLSWDFFITERLFINPKFGFAVHNGDLLGGDDRKDYGSPINFYEAIFVGYKLGEYETKDTVVDLELIGGVKHYSNAGFGSTNPGADMINIGLQFRFRNKNEKNQTLASLFGIE